MVNWGEVEGEFEGHKELGEQVDFLSPGPCEYFGEINMLDGLGQSM